jgi:hypothetical protein
MGLEIVAYARLKPLRSLTDEERGCRFLEGHAFLVHPQFPAHAAGVDAELLYSARETFSFSSGSYSGYVRWLEQLARLVGIASIDLFWQRPKPGPFRELIDFVDCDATIGAVVCAKLAADFSEYAWRAARHPDSAFKERYSNWKHALEVGADRGCVALRIT